MEHESSLPHSQKPPTCPYTEPAPSSPYLQHPTSWRSVLILSSHLCLGLWSDLFPLGFPSKSLCTTLTHTRYMPHPSQSSQFYHPNNIWWAVQIIKLFIMYFSPIPRYLFPPRPKYSPQHPILKHPQPTFPLNVSDQVSHPHKTTRKIIRQ